MKDWAGKGGFVTGAASGIGFALAEALARRGVKVMMADIEEARLAEAAGRLKAAGLEVNHRVVDVADRRAVEEAARGAVARWGKVHVVCNNAGVVTTGVVDDIPAGDWDWIVDVNLKGVVHGVEAFLPHVEAHGEGGWFINTGSAAGLVVYPTMEPYAATKYAVVAMSEGWAQQFEPKNIGVSVICPGAVSTHIYDSWRNKAQGYGAVDAHRDLGEDGNQAVKEGFPPAVIAKLALEAVERGDLYVMTHVDFRPVLEARYQALLDGFEKARSSKVLAGQAARRLPPFFTAR